jgi:hypothetical protein
MDQGIMMAEKSFRHAYADLQSSPGMVFWPIRLRSCVVLLFVIVILVVFSPPLLANPLSSQNHPQPAPDSSAKVKTIGMIIVALMAMSYQIYKKKRSTKGKYRKNKQHDKQVEELIALKKTYKSYYKQMYPENTPEDKLTIECQSCQTVNLLYAAHCTYCNEVISLNPAIIMYQDKIKELENQIKEKESSPSS